MDRLISPQPDPPTGAQADPIRTVVVGHGLAGRHFHCPLLQRQPELLLHGIVARSDAARAEAEQLWDVPTYRDLDEALVDPAVELVVIATPHDSHAELAIRTLAAGKHCVVDKVMALSTAEADAMIAARDRSGRMLSVFHNRRWDWDFLTLRAALSAGRLGRLVWVESSVCRHAPPRSWRGQATRAGTILHDWGAHLVDQALILAAQDGLGPCRRITCSLTDAPWPGVDSGGHGRILLEFGHVPFTVETSRVCPLDRPRWWVLGTAAGYVQHGIDPQEDALRKGDLDAAAAPTAHRARLRVPGADGIEETILPTVRESWDSYYANIVAHLRAGEPLAVTAEQAREVVRVLDAAWESARSGRDVEGSWGHPHASQTEST